MWWGLTRTELKLLWRAAGPWLLGGLAIVIALGHLQEPPSLRRGGVAIGWGAALAGSAIGAAMVPLVWLLIRPVTGARVVRPVVGEGAALGGMVLFGLAIVATAWGVSAVLDSAIGPSFSAQRIGAGPAPAHALHTGSMLVALSAWATVIPRGWGHGLRTIFAYIAIVGSHFAVLGPPSAIPADVDVGTLWPGALAAFGAILCSLGACALRSPGEG